MADVLAKVWPKGEVTDPVQGPHARPSGTSQTQKCGPQGCRMSRSASSA
jgi:hypothetical protein